MKKYIVLVLFLLSISKIQGQWIKEKGKGYYKISGWSLLADEHFTD
ncbi:hypothetical protein N9V25_03020 [Flavobacteriaceae bacterium]|nr:hypothetical protein [Flavobacteriaceae bacterium]